MSSHPPAERHPDDPPDLADVRRQRCQQCQALVLPAALNDLLRCVSCTGQLDLFPLPH